MKALRGAYASPVMKRSGYDTGEHLCARLFHSTRTYAGIPPGERPEQVSLAVEAPGGLVAGGIPWLRLNWLDPERKPCLKNGIWAKGTSLTLKVMEREKLTGCKSLSFV